MISIFVRDRFASVVIAFVSVQSALLEAFFERNPTVRDWIYLTDVPRRTEITVGDRQWRCIRHGVGIRFEGDDGIVVDAHRVIVEGMAIDAHRIEEWIRTTSRDIEGEVDIHELCERALEDLELTGVIEPIDAGGKLWRLCDCG